MSDNHPPSWPAAPEIGETAFVKKPVNKVAGGISLGLTVLLLLVELFTLLAITAAGDGPKILGVFFRSSPVLAGLWGGAVINGILGRRTVPGKFGLAISLIDLALYVYLVFQYQRLTF